jgi:two-component system, chemotaxis family, sensor kinase Cph1
MVPDISLTAPPPDLSQCEAEPIHIPGSIQPHGALLALHGPALRITQASATCQALLGLAAADLLERELAVACDPTLADAVRVALTRYQEGPETPVALRWQPSVGDCAFAGYVHLSDQLVVLELERVPPTSPAPSDLLTQAADAFSVVRAQTDLLAKAQSAAELFRRLTGYDRVMIYRFDEDWHGEVIAEALRPDLEPYLGLHYPASDIPAQARRLYVISDMRVILDVDYVPSPLLPAVNPVTSQPLDLSRSLLRSVSPVHLEYLRNMGVRSSLTVPLLREGQLWGLIACHHGTPHPVAGDIRKMAGWMGQDLATQIALTQEVRTRRYTAQLKQYRDNIVVAMRGGARLADLLNGPELPDVLGAIGAEGVALIRGADVTTGGLTPDPQRIFDIVAGLSARYPNSPSTLFATDALGEHLAGTEDLAATAAGVGIYPLDAAQSIKLVWFRGESLRHVNWAGNPDKAVNIAADGRLSPRRSFAAWAQTVGLHSLRWSPEELESAREIGALIDIEWRNMAEDAVRVSEERLQRVLDGANDGFWDWNVATGELLFSRHYAQILGYDLAELEPHLRAWEQLVHPDDLPRAWADLQSHFSGATPRYQHEHRLCAKNGEWHWILERGKVTARDARASRCGWPAPPPTSRSATAWKRPCVSAWLRSSATPPR